MSTSIKGLLPLMNASSNVSNPEIANKVATTAALFRKYFPDASVNLVLGIKQMIGIGCIPLIFLSIFQVGVQV